MRIDHRPSSQSADRSSPRRIFGLLAALPLACGATLVGGPGAVLATLLIADLSRAAPADTTKPSAAAAAAPQQGESGDLGAGDALAAITQGELRSFIAKAVQSYTGRAFSVDRLDVDLGLDAIEVRAGGITLANADWGRAEDMLTVDSLKARIDVGALFTGSIVAPLVDIDGARVVYAINENGESNLPLPKTKREQQKPFSLASLPLVREAKLNDVTAIYRNLKTGVNTELDLSNASLAVPEGEPMTLTADGRYDGAPLKLDVRGGTWQALTEQTDKAFPVNLDLALAALTASASGSIAEPATLQGIDLKVDLNADEIPTVYPIGGVFVRPTPALRFAGHLTSQTDEAGTTRYTIANLDAGLGESKITDGVLTVSMAGPRPRVEGRIRASRFWFDDLTAYFSAPKPKEDKSTGVLPTSSFWPLPAFRAANANLDFELADFRGFGLYFDMLSGTATTSDGVFRFEPLHGTRGEAEMTTWVSVYSNADPVKTDVKAEVSRLNLDRRVDNLPVANVPVTGRLSSRVNLGMDGNSIARMAGTANGDIVFAIDKGQASGLLLELLGLDVAESLGLLVSEDDEDVPVAIRCALGNVPVDDGVMSLKTFVIDTADTVIKADGTVGLGEETLDLEVVPYPKDFSLLSLRAPIGIQGTFAKPEIFTDPAGIGVESTADKVINAILTPIAGLLPPFDTGLDEDSDCRKLMEEAGISTG